MRITIITLSLVSMLITGCTSMRPLSSKPPESAIVLKSPVKVGVVVAFAFPAGEYRPLYEDDGGYYYQAPSKVIFYDFPFSRMIDGGLYVERTATEPTQWYYIDLQYGQKHMIHCESLPEHTLVP